MIEYSTAQPIRRRRRAEAARRSLHTWPRSAAPSPKGGAAASLRRGLAALLALLLVVGSAVTLQSDLAGATGQEGAQEDLTSISITLDAHDFAFEGPSEVPAGLVSIEMTNDGQEPHHAQLVKLNDGVTLEQFQEALQAGDPAAIFPLATNAGGPGAVAPGGTSEVILRLDAGTYVALCFIESPDGVPHLAKGMVFPFTVTGEDSGEPDPAADADFTMFEYSFEMPTAVPAGPQVWKVANEGVEPHELVIFKLAPGQTVEDFIAFVQPMIAPEATAGTEGEMDHSDTTPPATDGPPFAEAGGLQAIDGGRAGWIVLDLEPGEYVAACFVPSPDGVPHLMLGMIQGFTVQ